MKLTSISFQNNENNSDVFKKFKNPTYKSNFINKQKSDIVENNISNNNTKIKFSLNLKYSGIILGLLSFGLLFINRKKVSSFIKNIFTKILSHEPKIKPESDGFKIPNVENEVFTSIPKDSTPKQNASKIIINDYNEKVYQKFKGIQSQKEVYASKVYELTGVKTPKMELIGFSFNPDGLESKFIEGLKDLPVDDPQVYSDICQNFAADVLVANKNILKSCKLDSNNNVIRVNFSDTLGLKKDGTQEHFGVIVDELTAFLDPKKNSQNEKVYTHLTREDLIKSLERIKLIEYDNLRKISTLDNCSSILNHDKYSYTLMKRTVFLNNILERVKNTEQNSLSLLEYIEKIKNEEIKNAIKSEISYSALKDIEHSIGNIENNETKLNLSSLLEKRRKHLSINDINPTKISDYEVGKMLEKYTHKSYKPSLQEYKQIKEKYGDDYGYRIINALEKPLSILDICDMTKIANIKNGKYLEFWKNNPEKMVIYINSNTTKDGQVTKFNEDAWDTVIGAYKSFWEKEFDKKAIAALLRYGDMGAYDNINGVFRFNNGIKEAIKLLEENPNISANDTKKLKKNLLYLYNLTQKHIRIGSNFEEGCENNDKICKKLKMLLEMIEKSSENKLVKEELKKLKAYMESIMINSETKKIIEDLKELFILSTDTERNLKLGRNETSKCFGSLFLNNENLAELMKEAIENPEVREKILNHFNVENPELIQPGFLSTSIHPYNLFFGDVKWSLKLEKGVKYSYVSDLYHLFNKQLSKKTEAEILIHPGHKIKILNAEYDGKKWQLKGIILPNDQ